MCYVKRIFFCLYKSINTYYYCFKRMKCFKEVIKVTNRITVALSVLVDLKLNEGADIIGVIKGLDCNCLDTTGEATVMGADIQDRHLIIEKDDEPDVE